MNAQSRTEALDALERDAMSTTENVPAPRQDAGAHRDQLYRLVLSYGAACSEIVRSGDLAPLSSAADLLSKILAEFDAAGNELAARTALAEQERMELRATVERLEREKEAAERNVLMYRDAWVRELRGGLVPKMYTIDSLVLTTRKRMEELDAATARAEGMEKALRARVEQWNRESDENRRLANGSVNYEEGLADAAGSCALEIDADLAALPQRAAQGAEQP